MPDLNPNPASHAAPTATGLAANVCGALSYVLGPITGILFLVLEKENRFVRFHAAQSIGISVAWFVLWVGLTMLSYILGMMPIIGWITAILFFLLSIPLALASFAVWLFLMYRAYQGIEWQFPLVGPHAMRVAEQSAVSV